MERRYTTSLKRSIGTNASAYGFSVMITASYGVLSTSLGNPTVGDVFLFTTGAVLGFVLLEIITTRGHSRSLEAERSDVVAYGALFSLGSITAGVGAAALVAAILDSGVAWPLGAAAATITHLLVVGLETLLARTEKGDG